MLTHVYDGGPGGRDRNEPRERGPIGEGRRGVGLPVSASTPSRPPIAGSPMGGAIPVLDEDLPPRQVCPATNRDVLVCSGTSNSPPAENGRLGVLP